MSNITNKGRALTTRRKSNKLTSKEKSSQQDFGNNTSLFDSFISVRSSKQQKDDSSHFGSSSNIKKSQENATDVFAFPEKNSGRLSGDNIFLETTIPVQQTTIVNEETKIDVSLIQLCPKAKPKEQNKPQTECDESLLLFENNFEINSGNSETSFTAHDARHNKGENRDTSFNDDVPIEAISKIKPLVTGTATVLDENLLGVSEESGGDERNQCPVCLRNCGPEKYLSHIKSCASKNKLSTQKLLSALKLHKKQLAERKELGLGLPVQGYKAKVSPKRLRANQRKGPVDSSLQLALALSASLQSAQEDEVIQEAEALKDAGLCEEAEQKLSTLEKYGFASDAPLQPRSVSGGSKSRQLPPSLLFRRTQEERERIVTEKIAIVLISEEENVNPISYEVKEPALKSKLLREKLDKENRLWNKSFCPEDEKREAFYVKSLSQFVTPSKSEVGDGLRRLSQLPGRIKTPDETDIADLPTPLRPNVRDVTKKVYSTSDTLGSLSRDWEKLINNSLLSDVKIKAMGDTVIPAHKLVFHARCPKVVDEIVKEANGEETIDWSSVSVNSVLSFLEYVYCARTDKILMLDVHEFDVIQNIADKFDCEELKTNLNGSKKCSSGTKPNEVKKNLFETDCTDNMCNYDSELLDNQNVASELPLMSLTSKNNSREMSVDQSNFNENICNGRESPDMFDDSGNHIESQHERDDLDVLISLIGKPTQNWKESSESLVACSPASSCRSGIVCGKRKASNISLSEDEDTSLSKKPRSDCFESQSKEEMFDLTQSSNASSEEGDEKVNLESEENALVGTKDTVDECDLTQSSESSREGGPKSSKVDQSRIDESDDGGSLADLTQKPYEESISKTIPVLETPDNDVFDPIQNECNGDSNYNFNITKNSSKTPSDTEPLGCTHSTSQVSHSTNLISSTSHSSELSYSDRVSISQQIDSTTPNIPTREKHDYMEKDDNVQDFIDPVWDGFDDYYQQDWENNISLKTPGKNDNDTTRNSNLSESRFRFNHSSVSPKICVTDISSGIKSPRWLKQTVLSPLNGSPKSIKSISSDNRSPKVSRKNLTPSSSSSVKYISSESKTPKSLSKKVVNVSPLSNLYSKPSDLSAGDSDLETTTKGSATGLISPHNIDNMKSRKNLSIQFNTTSTSCSQKSYSQISEDHTVTKLSQKSSESPSKSSLRKDSLAAMQRLLDDSFEVDERLFDNALASGSNGKSHQSFPATSCVQDSVIAGKSNTEVISLEYEKIVDRNSRSKKSLDTPSPGIIVSDKVTPQPDYSGMKTPALKKELCRFGLKPSLGRRKAKLLLRYIYDQTHPVVPDSDGRVEEFKLPEGQPPQSPRKTVSTVGSPRKERTSSPPGRTVTVVNLDDSGSETDEHCSQMSTSSSISSAPSLPEESYHEAEDVLTKDLTDSGDVRSSIRGLITGDPELYRKVLMYEPIYLEDIVAMLKANGVRSKANDVMDFLDEQCITFRTNSWKTTNEKRRQKQKSPKKKKKQQSSTDPLNTSPPKSETQETLKKRGRPRKNNV